MKKVVYKYATGQEIPEGAKYLCTLTETKETVGPSGDKHTFNYLVWHYYDIEVKE